VDAKLGEKVQKGQPLARVRFSDPARWEAQREGLAAAWVIGDTTPEIGDLIVERIDATAS